MLLREDLEAGRSGLRWVTPAAFEWKREHQALGIAADEERRVTWLVRFLPWPLDLRPAFDDVLRADLEEESRFAFEKADKGIQWPPGSGEKPPPRTSDPTWSPVVESEHVRIGGAPALRFVRRLTYRPGNEALSGALLVPLKSGFAEIDAIARAGMTGYRESVLLLKQGPPGPDKPFPKQHVYDDPAHDATFADHPLSLVRAALRWLLSEGGLEVTGPMEPPPDGEVELPAPQCAVVPPPRYIAVPHELLPMSPTLTTFVRSVFGDSDPRLVGVWRLPDRIEGGDRAGKLRRLAVETNEGWAREGASDIEQETVPVGGDGRNVAVQSMVRFKVGDKPKLSAQRWRADEDGTVFRVTGDGPGHQSEAALADIAEGVMASLRRTDAAAGEPERPEKKPWWKRW